MSNYETRVQKDLVTDAVFTESSEEFILPDYMPEIGRVLRVGAALLPDEHYEGSDGTEFSGRIEYRLLYSDSEGNITEAPLEGRYRYRVPSGGKITPVIYTEERIENVNARPSAPRKLGIRTRIFARPHLLTEEEIGTSLSSLVGEAPAETIIKEIEALDRSAYNSGGLHAEGSFQVEDVAPDALSLLSVQSAVLPETKEAHDGYLSVRGRLIFTLLLKKEDAVPFIKVCTLPFEEEITVEGAKEGDRVTLRAFVASPSVTLEADGEHTTILLDAEYSLAGMLARNRTVSILEDLYVHGACYEIEKKTFFTEQLVGCASTFLTVGSELSLPESFKSDGCLFPLFSLKESTVSRVGEKAIAEGALSVSLLSFGSDETEKCEMTLPFRVELSLAETEKEGENLTLTVAPAYGSAQAVGDSIRLSAEISVCVLSTVPLSLSLPIAAKKVAEKERDGQHLILYYPTDGDTLWTVAKRYSIPLSALKRQNGIPEAEESTVPLDGYSYLFVNEL